MRPTVHRSSRHAVTLVTFITSTALAVLAACADAPVGPQRSLSPAAPSAKRAAPGELTAAQVVTQLKSATAKYHDLEAATRDGFVFLHGCEVRPGEGAVGTVYVHLGRLFDGVIDPREPDGLIYDREPNGKMRLMGVELALPYDQWSGPARPTLAGQTFQREDEFGVYALHAWIWRANPAGTFAEGNPTVRCLEER